MLWEQSRPGGAPAAGCRRSRGSFRKRSWRSTQPTQPALASPTVSGSASAPGAGAVVTRAMVRERITPGTVFIPFHFAEAAGNVLTHAALDPIAKIPEYKVCAVALQPGDETSAPA